jgi:hypothetical protein
MPRRGQHDQSPGDGRQPFADQGGPEGRHAQTHDVRREELTNPKGPGDQADPFAADPVPSGDEPVARLGGHAEESVPAAADKGLREQLGDLAPAELARLAVLEPGTRLQAGGTYVDLNDAARAPFTALGGHEAGPGDRYVAKRDTDHELWNRLVGQGREVETERPAGATD